MIYFDHSATTPTDKEVFNEMAPYFTDDYGNPSSIHKFGQKAIKAVDKARSRVAGMLNASPEEVIFTSGATESNNLALKGIIEHIFDKQGKVGPGNCMDIEKENREETAQKGFLGNLMQKKKAKPHIITTSIEHKAILEPCVELERKGVEVTYLKVDGNGLISLEELEGAIKENTVLVSIMYVNSEVGAEQPIFEAGKIIKKINDKRVEEWKKWQAKKKIPKPAPIYFHSDATQAVNFFDCDVERLNLHLLSMSSHKIYGPKGVGALFVAGDVKIKGVQTGGGQERKIRSGTLNVPGIVGLGKAADLINGESREVNNKKIGALRDMLVAGVEKSVPDVALTVARDHITPSHAHFVVNGVEGESGLISLDMEGIAVSTGSACAAKDLHPSHVLNAMGLSREQANYALRITLGKHNTEDEVRKFLEVFPGIVERVRGINPIYN
jgi:cysteine desulfurase